MILVSACLLGVNCKYSGGNNKNQELISLLKDKKVLPVCPEELGGLPTPRCPAEIIGGTGFDVLDGKAKVRLKDGTEVTREFSQGAEKTLETARSHQAKLAVLKNGSPSCGVTRIYDGTFTGKTIPGLGVSAALLKRSGIAVISEETPQNKDILTLIEENN